ncbi:proline--tRNA ligase [Phototrophicus methaneseepsis]|uniref:Proline--tRNA ligase n=1 Tax=Phototrophicus methaneseepsis TaxID=2710758 RepID=A0A7S8E7U4_9CHLR|nr:proline--tRNA ligase [Phototrophicus methaneseepsis]QPC81893.1 proline--tRNA ligase [Phototrophicus methaneseepsis]
MSKQGVTPQSENFSDWYNEIVYRADLAARSPVRGCLIIKPYGYEIWEAIHNSLDRRFKETGHQNAYFPLFIPESYLKREAEHVEGFSPELAVVTVAGGKELEEPLVVRPTSETVIGEAFSEWIQSYRDLPLLINQWANVVRWELRTRPFLRTSEFLWQEGHTAHATHEEAEAETLQMLDVYADFAINEAAIPVIKGLKSNIERFAGALRTYTIEGMMRDTRALQSGTSHNLGQNFAKAFDIKYLDEQNEQQYCWTTSWGMSTRMIGAIIMTHGDDQGLRLPPKVAPYQVVAIPIFRKEEEEAPVMEKLMNIVKDLRAAGIRVHVDDRNQSPGFKFNDWEMRGVPVRLEIGPKDVEKGNAVLVRRDVAGRDAKQFVSQDGIVKTVQDLLDDVQASLLADATAFRDANIHDVSSYDEFRQVIDGGGWARGWWAGSDDNERQIKEDTGATLRCIPLEQPGGTGTCFYSDEVAQSVALFAKAY